MEIWKDIEGYDNYAVSNFGRFKNKVRGRIIKGSDNGRGYIRVKLCQNGEACKYVAHFLVAKHFIEKPDGKYLIDHKDGNGHNNNMSNLRWATQSDNMANRKKRSDKTTSKYKGVSFVKQMNKWKAQVWKNGVQTVVGMFDDEIDAGKAYDETAKKLFGEFAKCNF